MDIMEYKHELVIPNRSIPVKIFSFSAHNDSRIIPAHWHRSAEILYVKRGKLNVWMNEQKYVLKEADFIYINSKEVHSTQSPENNEVIVLQIPGDFLETFSNRESLMIHCNTIDIKQCQEFDEIRKLLCSIYSYSLGKNEVYYLKVYSLVFELGYILIKKFRVKNETLDIKSKKYLDLLSEICTYIKINYQDNLTLNNVSSQFGYSPQYLARIFKKYTGQTFLIYLNSVRLNYAYKEMMNSDLSLLTIAENNGFSSVKSFSKIFKNIYGEVPSVYRKKINNIGQK